MLNTNLDNRLNVTNMTQAQALSYINKNYDISVGGNIELTGVGKAGYGYFYNRKSGVYNLQHYYDRTTNKMYERIITEQLADNNWTVTISDSDLQYYIKGTKIKKVKWVYEEDSNGPYICLNAEGKNIAFWRVDGTY